MKLSDIEGVQSPVVKLQELVGKMIEIDFQCRPYVAWGPPKDSFPDDMTVIVPGYCQKKLLLISGFYIEILNQANPSGDIIEIMRDGHYDKQNSYSSYHMTSLRVLSGKQTILSKIIIKKQ